MNIYYKVIGGGGICIYDMYKKKKEYIMLYIYINVYVICIKSYVKSIGLLPKILLHHLALFLN